jgi:hypothetical protein
MVLVRMTFSQWGFVGTARGYCVSKVDNSLETVDILAKNRFFPNYQLSTNNTPQKAS